MSEEDALLAAIYANPDDDTPRLVYADWLDEHDRPERAEFIRVQIAMVLQEDQRSEEAVRAWKRQDELLKAHEQQWTADLGPFDREKVFVNFFRGFPESLTIGDGTPSDCRILSRLPHLRRLEIVGGTLSPAALRAVAELKQLDSLSIYNTPFRTAWLKSLDPLPFWTYVRIEGDSGGFDRAWEKFQERRLGKMTRATVAKRREGARRFVNAVFGTPLHPAWPVKSVSFSQIGVCDAELRLVSYLPELETVNIFQGHETEAGLVYLADLPNLKSVELLRSPVNSIVPLTACASLESIWVSTEDGSLTDDGTVGLERLTNLYNLRLWSDGLGDGTVRRLAPLRQLRSLELSVGELDGDSLAAIAGHTKLESLRIDGPVGDDDLRHFAGLTSLTFLSIDGTRATDAGLRHLTRLTKLRTLKAQSGYSGEQFAITEAGARALANQLPEVTIILDRYVVKSPRPAITFRRRALGESASLLLPKHWGGEDHSGRDTSLNLVEDGWENVGSWSGGIVGRAEVWAYVCDGDSDASLNGRVQNNSHLNPRVLERDVVKLTGKTGASCVFQRDGSKHLVAAVAAGGRCVVLDCDAPPARFDEFRSMFEFVARSLRVGKAAMKNVGEEKTVAVSRL